MGRSQGKVTVESKKLSKRAASRRYWECAPGEQNPLALKLHSGVPLRAEELAALDPFLRFRYAQGIRRKFKGHWNANAEHLYLAFVRALDIDPYEDELLRLAKAKRGRKPNQEHAQLILSLKSRLGYNPSQIREALAKRGIHKSEEAIKSYSKRRRTKLKH
jgi:hypothetical protein